MGESDAKPFLRLGRWIRWGVFLYLSPVARNVLTVLVAYTNRDGVAYPSGQTIARESGHKRAKVYPALKEIVLLGLYRQGEQVTWTHAGGAAQYHYHMQELDVADLETMAAKRALWKSGHTGDVGRLPDLKKRRRDVPKTGTPQSSRGGPKTGTPETVRGVPKLEPRGVPRLGNRGVPKLGTQRGKGKRVLRGNTLTSDSLSRSKTGSEEKKRRKQREGLRAFFMQEVMNGNEILSVDVWISRLPHYHPEDVRAQWLYVYKRVQ